MIIFTGYSIQKTNNRLILLNWLSEIDFVNIYLTTEASIIDLLKQLKWSSKRDYFVDLIQEYNFNIQKPLGQSDITKMEFK